MRAVCVMVLGTTSGAGKSWLASFKAAGVSRQDERASARESVRAQPVEALASPSTGSG